MKKNLLLCISFILFFLIVSASAQPELDTTFNGTGKIIFGGQLSSATSVIVQPDNKVLIAGGTNNLFNLVRSFDIYRLNENGSLDSTYAAPPNNIPGSSTGAEKYLNGIALQNDGKIVAVGYAFSAGNQRNTVIARYNSDGNLDTSFGTGGYIVLEFTGESYGRGIVVQPDQKIAVVGYVASSPSRQFVARFNSNGTPDSAFGNAGIVNFNLQENNTGRSIALQADGKIVTGGSASSGGLVTRLNRDGSLDTTFDGDGYSFVGINNLVSIAIQADGRILALSSTSNNLYRLNSDGSLDTSFANGGMRQALAGTSLAYEVKVTPGGKITVVGHQPFNPIIVFDFRIAKYLSDGSPDTSFSGDGYLDVNTGGDDGGRALNFDRKGKTVIAGLAGQALVNQAFANFTFAAIRLIANPVQNVKFTGRATLQNGTPARNAIVTLKNGSQVIRQSLTNPFGYFRFANIPTNETYTVSIHSKKSFFYDREVLIDDTVNEYLIVGEK